MEMQGSFKLDDPRGEPTDESTAIKEPISMDEPVYKLKVPNKMPGELHVSKEQHEQLREQCGTPEKHKLSNE
eukprot:8357594-Ditylum_brightwellii.AAC.1